MMKRALERRDIDLPDVKLAMARLQQHGLLQVLLNDVHLPLIINVLQELIGIVGYQNTNTCMNGEVSITYICIMVQL